MTDPICASCNFTPDEHQVCVHQQDTVCLHCATERGNVFRCVECIDIARQDASVAAGVER